MTVKAAERLPVRLTAIALVLSAGPASAMQFDLGDGWQGDWVSTFSLGASWRAEDPSNLLYTPQTGAEVGRNDGRGGGAVDAGNVNYDKGDNFSTLAKIITEVSIKKGDFGAFVRGKGWYDYALEEGDVNYGNQANGYKANSPMSDKGFDTLNKFSGVYLLDAYVYNTFQIADMPLQVRVGRQGLNWGESVFIQGINQVNPIDVPSFRRPGAQLKEVFLPVWMVSANQSLGAWGSLEAYYQLKWEYTPIEGCGNYWAPSEQNLTPDVSGCSMAIAAGALSSRDALPLGAYVDQSKGREGKDSGQFGVAYRFTVDSWNYTEFGLYAQKLNSRTPIISVLSGDCNSANTTVCADAGLANPIHAMGAVPGVVPFSAFWEYPNDIKIYGLSAATELFGWSFSAELSRTEDLPAQVSGADLLYGALTFAGPYGAYAAAQTAAGPGNDISGYTRTSKTQFQVNTLKAGNGVLWAQQYVLLAEAGAQWNGLPNNDGTHIRYGRGFIYGAGSDPRFDFGTPAGGNLCDPTHPLYNPQPDGCKNQGYVDEFSWGARLYVRLEYPDVLGTGVTVYPGLFVAQDVNGNSVDSQFVDERRTISPSVGFGYQKKYQLDLTYATYNNKAEYDNFSDHDFYSANFSINF